MNCCDPPGVCARNQEPDRLPPSMRLGKLLLSDPLLISEIEMVSLRALLGRAFVEIESINVKQFQ